MDALIWVIRIDFISEKFGPKRFGGIESNGILGNGWESFEIHRRMVQRKTVAIPQWRDLDCFCENKT